MITLQRCNFQTGGLAYDNSAQQIFDSSTHLYQVQSIVIAKDLRTFFNKNPLNTIEFWECPSNAKSSYHMEVDKETKQFNLIPCFPSKTSWDFSKKEKVMISSRIGK